MSFPHPTDEELAQLEVKCDDCHAAPEAWCVTDGEVIKMRPVLHRIRQPKQRDMVLGDRSGSSGAKADILGPVCKNCGLAAAFEVRDPDRMTYSCHLHILSTFTDYLITSNVVAVSLINKNTRRADRRKLAEALAAHA